MLGLLAVAAAWGLFWGGWAALLPQLKDDLDLSDQGFGLALFAIPVGALPAMAAAGRLTRTLGARALPLMTGLFALACVLVGLAPSPAGFTAALLLLGASSGAIEVALNATLAVHEARDGTRLFNKVHAATPLAMVVAAPSVGLAREAGASATAVLVVVAVAVAASAVLAADPRPWPAGPARPTRFWPAVRPLLLVGGVAGVALLMENAVEQWGAVHLEQDLDTGPLMASLAPGCYMAGLSAGRILAQYHGPRFGDRLLVTVAGLAGAAGIITAAAAAQPPVALVGFAVAGVGLAPVIPTMFAAAGRAAAPERRAESVSAVTAMAYVGFLASPPLVGTLAGWHGTAWALGLVALGGVPIVAGRYALHRLDRPATTG